MKKTLIFVLLLAIMFILTSFAGTRKPTRSQSVLYRSWTPTLDASRDGFIDALKKPVMRTISLDIQNARGDTNNLSTISDRFVNNNVNLVLAIATPSAGYCRKNNGDPDSLGRLSLTT